MRWADGYIAVDWGTTNRRAYLIDSSGACADEFEDDKGILSVQPGSFGPVVNEITSFPDSVTGFDDSVDGMTIALHQLCLRTPIAAMITREILNKA